MIQEIQGLVRRPYCHWEGLGDPYYRDVGPGKALADTDLYNAGQVKILASNPTDVNATLNAFCNSTMRAPIQAYGAHVTSLGLRFYTGTPFVLQLALIRFSCSEFGFT